MQNKQEVISYWKESAEKDRQTAKDLIRLGHNHWGLFIWHLVIEKILKGLLVKEDQETAKTHNLFRMATDLKDMKFTEEHLEWLREVTTFNLEARYNTYKFEFYKKATPEYTEKWDGKCEELYQWLMKQY